MSIIGLILSLLIPVLGVENVVICGIEGHVCVKATVYELLKRGINTHIVVDGVSSRSMTDRSVHILDFRVIKGTTVYSDMLHII